MPLDGVTYLYDPTLIKNDELTQTIIVSDFEKILVATQLNERTLRKSGIDKNAFATFPNKQNAIILKAWRSTHCQTPVALLGPELVGVQQVER